MSSNRAGDGVILKTFQNIPFSKVSKLRNFSLSDISPASVILATKHLNSGRSEDIYGLSTYVVKHIIDIIAPSLCILFNASLMQGKFPSLLKNSVIIPIHKKGSKKDPANYRPISLVPIFSKIFEHIILVQLRDFCKRNDILNDCQYGFKKGSSTIDAILKLVDEIYGNFNLQKITSAVMLDLSKAFDSISHSKLIAKLNYYGIMGSELNLIRSYLFDRNQVVKTGKEISSVRCVNRGVPQGSLLGPFLFLLYMNDLPSALTSSPILYADDTSIVMSHTNLLNLQVNLKQELDKALNWFNANDLHLNPNKTEHIIFSLNKTITCMNQNKFVKYLGLCIDDSLTWNYHVDYITSKLAKTLYLIRRLSYSLSLPYLCMYYYASFQSHISYGILLWGCSNKTVEVFKWQKKAIRVILNVPYNASCRGLFKKLGFLTVPCLYIFHCVMYVKSHLYRFESVEQIHSYNTRNCKSKIIPNNRLSKTQKTYKVYGLTFYNILKQDIRDLPLKKFKLTLKELLLQSEGYSISEIEEYIKKSNTII
jgi:hypothetical protein